MLSFRSRFKEWTEGYATRLKDLIRRGDSDPERFERIFKEVSGKLPVPVIWLLGKTQSGKSSIVRGLTGATKAEVGNGFQPCTRTSSMYSYPTDEDCVVRFLDTRGLGEVDYDPAEDLRVSEQQSHLLLVVIRAMDHALQSVLKPLREIHQRHPEWPVIVVQTSLHEGYPDRGMNHPEPYPFGAEPWPNSVPEDLRRSLLHQRNAIDDLGIDVRYAAVDLTLPEDGYQPTDYGLEALWEAIEELVPVGLRGVLAARDDLQGELREYCSREAQSVILSHALSAGAVALVPVPAVDIPGVLAIQARMCRQLAGIYHQSLDTRGVAELFGALGTGMLLRMGGRELLKFIPGAGSVIASVYAAGMTYALGLTLTVYFSRVRDGAVPDAAEFRALYQKYSRIGQERMRDYLRRTPPVTPPPVDPPSA